MTNLARLADEETAHVVLALIETLQNREPGVRLAAVNALHVVTADDPQAKTTAASLVATLRDAYPRCVPGL